MFVEFKTKQGKRIAYGVSSILFVGEWISKVSVKSNDKTQQRLPDRYGNHFEKISKSKTSIMLSDGTFQEAPEEYENVSEKVIKALSFVLHPKDCFIELKTRKKERALCYIPNIFSVLEMDEGISIVYKDGIEQEYGVNYERFMYRISKHYKIQEEK